MKKEDVVAPREEGGLPLTLIGGGIVALIVALAIGFLALGSGDDPATPVSVTLTTIPDNLAVVTVSRGILYAASDTRSEELACRSRGSQLRNYRQER